MMSKSSFLVSLKENNKRRLWVWVISFLSFVLIFPVYTALVVKNTMIRTEWIVESYGAELAREILHERLISSMTNTLGFSILISVLTTAIAVISAVQGFSWLYSRKKIDFYMGMPVKRKKRFFQIWLNGIFLYVVPYFLGLLISMLIAASNGGMDREVARMVITAFGGYICFYLCVYHMAVLAVMLTGNIVITGFALVIFWIYESLVRIVLYSYKQMFFQHFSTYGNTTFPILSPFGVLLDLVNHSDDRLISAGKLLLFALVLLGIAYFCYMKRPAEAAGRAMTFENTKPVVKILLIVPTALLAAGVIAEVVNYEPLTDDRGIGYVIFAIVLVIIIGSALIQVIYEFDIKGALHKKAHIVIAGVLTAIIFMAFRYDFTGYDSYIPDKDTIESVAFVPDCYENAGIYGDVHFDRDGSYLSEQEYADKYMHLKNVEEIHELVETSMNDYHEFLRAVDQEGYKDDQTENWAYTTLIYHLKNGRSVSRVIWVDVNNARTTELLDQIMGSEEFKKGYMTGASESIDALLADTNGKRKISAAYGNIIYNRKISAAEAEEFLEVYRKDLALANFSKIKQSTPIAVFSLYIEEEIEGSSYIGTHGISRATRSWDVGINIYPFYEKSIAWLKANGYYMEGQLDLKDVDHIQVINSNSEAAAKLQESLSTTAGASAIGFEATQAEAADVRMATEMYGEYDVDTRVYADYVEEEDIARIASCILPEDMVYGRNWDGGERYESEYRVIVYFKAESEVNRSYGVYASYCFMKGQVPDFVMEDTLYK